MPITHDASDLTSPWTCSNFFNLDPTGQGRPWTYSYFSSWTLLYSELPPLDPAPSSSVRFSYWNAFLSSLLPILTIEKNPHPNIQHQGEIAKLCNTAHFSVTNRYNLCKNPIISRKLEQNGQPFFLLP